MVSRLIHVACINIILFIAKWYVVWIYHILFIHPSIHPSIHPTFGYFKQMFLWLYNYFCWHIFSFFLDYKYECNLWFIWYFYDCHLRNCQIILTVLYHLTIQKTMSAPTSANFANNSYYVYFKITPIIVVLSGTPCVLFCFFNFHLKNF